MNTRKQNDVTSRTSATHTENDTILSWTIRQGAIYDEKCYDRALKSMTLCNKFGILYLFNDVTVSLLSILIPCIILYKYFFLHLLHYTWLRCIRSCIEDLSHGFLENRWFVHSRFMGLGNPLEVLVHHLLIGGMVSLSYWDGFPMVSTLVCMVAHWVGPMVSYDLRLSSSHDSTKLLHCIVSQPWENIKLVLKLAVTLTYKWDHKLIIKFLWTRLLLMEVDSNKYS